MVKRVSLKGKGADLFFGDYTPAAESEAVETAEPLQSDHRPPSDTEPSDLGGQPEPSPVPPEASATATHSRKNARKQESTLARMPESKQEPPRDALAKSNPNPSETASTFALAAIDRIWPRIAEPATLTNAFRYTEPELTELSDVTYDVSKSHRVKLSKQDIARLGLNVVLWDYRAHGDESLLSQLVRKRKQQRQGE